MTSVMIQLDDKIISRELFDEHFICDLGKCKGDCCVHGDAGAPLEDSEIEELENHISQISPYMRPEGIKAVDRQGTWVVDGDGEKVTPLVGKDECAYVIFEEGIARCAIEKAWAEGKLDFQKPVSCHLYPIRVNRLSNATALNYHRWGVCEPARILGKKEGLPVFRFLKEPITRVYGKGFYEELEVVYREIRIFEKEGKQTQ